MERPSAPRRQRIVGISRLLAAASFEVGLGGVVKRAGRPSIAGTGYSTQVWQVMVKPTGDRQADAAHLGKVSALALR